MKYMGSKAKYAKYLLPYILAERQPDQWYIEPFVGGANMIDKVAGFRIGSDINKYLISMWVALKDGWMPPIDITRDYYNECRNSYNKNDGVIADHIIGYVGFNGSYGGRFYDGGFAGITTDKYGNVRNYPLEAFENVIKQLPKINDIHFSCGEYDNIEIPPKSIIYCDKPYENTKEYKFKFDHDKFWKWCREQKTNGHTIFVSEYTAPSDFKCVVSLNAKSSLSANGQIGGNKNSVEKLFTL